jgi:hypothetical protein
MPLYRVHGIPLAVATTVRDTLRAPQYGHPAHVEVATGYGPCRLRLQTFSVGHEERLLFTYQPFADEAALPAPGPVFIHHQPCERYDEPEVPEALRPLPLVRGLWRRGRPPAPTTRWRGRRPRSRVWVRGYAPRAPA